MPLFNPQVETAPREHLQNLQMQRLRALLTEIDGRNAFYSERLRAWQARPEDFQTPADVTRLPFTTKQDLAEDQAEHPPFGRNLTYPESRYTRFHQTSGTTGQPLQVLDTPESWDWWGRCWGYVLAGAGLTAEDRLFVAFGFGPFIGFWAAVEGARHVQALLVPGGGRDSLQRLQLMRDTRCTALCCTPTYALRLAEVAQQNGFDLHSLPIRATVHAGEPGANVPATKRLLEEAWGAKCYDHAGATEVGAFAFECEAQPGGMHFNEAEFIIEVVHPDTGRAVEVGEVGELVVTNLGRPGFPVLRYRTGDMVRLATGPCDCGRTFLRCEGGILGRYDDMRTVRGVNVYPSALENLVRRVPGVVEFRVTVAKKGALDTLRVELECGDGPEPSAVAQSVSDSIRHHLGLRPEVNVVPKNTLPRFELKARRFWVE